MATQLRTQSAHFTRSSSSSSRANTSAILCLNECKISEYKKGCNANYKLSEDLTQSPKFTILCHLALSSDGIELGARYRWTKLYHYWHTGNLLTTSFYCSALAASTTSLGRLRWESKHGSRSKILKPVEGNILALYLFDNSNRRSKHLISQLLRMPSQCNPRVAPCWAAAPHTAYRHACYLKDAAYLLTSEALRSPHHSVHYLYPASHQHSTQPISASNLKRTQVSSQ